MAYPEGYRKAMRAMEIAERHGFPLIAFVDTPVPIREWQLSSTARAVRSPARRR